MSQLHEHELDRFVDQHLMWSPKVPLSRLIGPYARPDVMTSEFFRRGRPRIYRIGRRSVRGAVVTGVTRPGRSVADCVADHATELVDRRASSRPRRRIDAQRRVLSADGWVVQVPVDDVQGPSAGDEPELMASEKKNRRRVEQARTQEVKASRRQSRTSRGDQNTKGPGFQRISDGTKVELEESGWLRRQLPDKDLRRAFMKWLQAGHKRGEWHVHLRPGSAEAQKALARFLQEA